MGEKRTLSVQWARRCVLILAWLFVGVGGMMAQESGSGPLRVPDNEEVLMRTIDIESPYFLDRLLAKYLTIGEQLTDEEYHYLYYGYAYSDMYKPLEPIAAQDGVLAVVEEIMTEPTEERMRRLVESGLEVMECDPFSPNNLNLLAFAYGSLGDTVNERHYFERLEGVLRTIEMSGSGLKESSPRHVLWFSHASDLLHARGKEIKSREVVSRTCEYVFLRMKDENGALGYYFDFSRIYWVRSERNDVKEKRGWSINNVPIN